MINKAIAKITDEMMKIDNPHAVAVEEHLTEICKTEAVAEKLLNESKSLKGFLDLLWEEAKKRKKGNVAYIAPDEVWQMAEEYYGITEEDRNTVATDIQDYASRSADIIDITNLL